MLPLGQELKRRGHRVTLLGILDTQPQTLAAGLEFLAIGEADFPQGATRDLFAQLGQLSGLKALQYTITWIAKLAEAYLQDAPDVIRKAGINALLVDQASSAGGTIAQHLRIPFITVCSAVVLNRELAVPPFNTAWKYDPSWWGTVRN